MPQSLTKPNPVFVASVKALIDEGRTVTIPVRGWSMRIFVEHERDKALLEAPRADELRKGDVVLAEVAPQHYVLHRIIAADGERLTLMGDGNVVGTESCTRADVVARVTAFYRKGRTTPDRLDGLKWRAYSAVWLALRPVRRYILFIWRQLYPMKSSPAD